MNQAPPYQLPDNRTQWTIAVIAIVLAMLIPAVVTGAGLVVALGRLTTISGAQSAGTALPPWPAPQPAEEFVAAAGLELGPAEGFTQHFHAHLDVLVDGQAVAVPALIGIDEATAEVSEVHTHDTTGILHVESFSPDAKYTLGQFFTEWDVRLAKNQIGGLVEGPNATLRTFVNGEQYAGDPADITLESHQEIALVFGPATPTPDIPRSYTFPPNT